MMPYEHSSYLDEPYQTFSCGRINTDSIGENSVCFDYRRLDSSESFQGGSQYGSTDTRLSPIDTLERSMSSSAIQSAQMALCELDKARSRSAECADKILQEPRINVRHAFSANIQESVPKMIIPPYLLPSLSELTQWDSREQLQASSVSSISSKQLLQLSLLAWMQFISAPLFSMLVPFFPQEALQRDIGVIEIGAIIGIFGLGAAISSLLVRKMSTARSSKATVIVGAILAGLSTISFGLTYIASSRLLFFIICLLLRILQGASYAMLYSGVHSVSLYTFPRSQHLINSILRISQLSGFVVGPIVAGGLWQIYGLMVPFIVVGALLLPTGILSICAFSTNATSVQSFSSEPPSGQKPGISSLIPLLLNNMVGAASICFIYPSFERYLQEYSLPAMVTSASFGLLLCGYGVSFLLWGWIARKTGTVWPIIVIGGILTAVISLFIDPTVLLGLQRKLWGVIVCIFFLGFAAAMQQAPCLPEILRAALNRNAFVDYWRLFNEFDNLLFITTSFGCLLGPLLGGILAQYFDFAKATLTIPALQGAVLLYLMLRFLAGKTAYYCVCCYRRQQLRRDPLQYWLLESQ